MSAPERAERIAIVGSGISGLACAYYLTRDTACDVQVFESAGKIGGHTATVDVKIGGRQYAIDTGFIVYNDWTYPHFIQLLTDLGVATQPTRMSFSVSDQLTGLEWAGSGLDTLFAQRKNLLSPRFLGMVRDILRFNKRSVADLESGAIDASMTLGEYLRRNGYGEAFIEQYLVPMGSAIWSADTAVMQDFPLQFFVRFFRNHGLLNIRNRPQWRVIKGGSRQYLAPLTASFKDNIHTGMAVQSIQRLQEGALLSFADGSTQQFDRVVLACHSDQAYRLLADPSDSERQVLGAMRYQSNDVVLHTDTRLLPRARKTWSAWNYLLTDHAQRAVLTYNMNILQGIESAETFCVTLNHTDAINPHKILGRFNYWHPVFSLEQVAAQGRWAEVNRDRTWFCGAYWHNGFHEDGVRSALRVAEAIKTELGSARALVSAA
ncbi:MAG: FAD-dependent oxidoreductase [Halieaceae bacterium]|jgi:predicted NAD/FAD-binding protein|nr:FAD-dependent oxidoreductase [Halieaceae bacterium]